MIHSIKSNNLQMGESISMLRTIVLITIIVCIIWGIFLHNESQIPEDTPDEDLTPGQIRKRDYNNILSDFQINSVQYGDWLFK